MTRSAPARSSVLRPTPTKELSCAELRADFLSDLHRTMGEVKRRLCAGPEPWHIDRRAAQILREARTAEVWQFTTPHQVARPGDRLPARRCGPSPGMKTGGRRPSGAGRAARASIRHRG
jgi:hypothetical protein